VGSPGWELAARGHKPSVRRGSARDDRSRGRAEGWGRRPAAAAAPPVLNSWSSIRGREHDAGVRRVPGQSPPSRQLETVLLPHSGDRAREQSVTRDESAWRLIGSRRRQAHHGRRAADGRNTPIGRCPPGASDAMIVSAALSCLERARPCATRPRWHTGSGSAWSTGPGVGCYAPSMRLSGEASATIPTLPWQCAA
jgi:hypothetical protein